MAMDYNRYPDNWKEISERIRFERAENKCEWCGVENHSTILRSTEDGARYLVLHEDGIYYTPNGKPIRLSEMPSEFDDSQHTKVILTVAHLGIDKPDGTPGDKHDKMDVREENLAALCQRCHLNYDRDDHIENAKRARLEKRRQEILNTGQMELWP